MIPENPVILDNDDPKALAARVALHSPHAPSNVLSPGGDHEGHCSRFRPEARGRGYSGLSRTTDSPEKLSQTGWSDVASPAADRSMFCMATATGCSRPGRKT